MRSTRVASHRGGPPFLSSALSRLGRSIAKNRVGHGATTFAAPHDGLHGTRNSSIAYSVNVTIPTATAPGTYYLLACADDLGVVAEADETNNCAASTSTVIVQ